MNLQAPFADLRWSSTGQPYSLDFEDLYFSSGCGLEETRHVFLLHNHLAERWAELGAGEHFCIAETGFGTGLNFLCAWQLWDQIAPADTYLHFISTEKFPLNASDMQRAQKLWPELAPWSTELLTQYSDLTPGWQHFVLAGGRVTLTLLVGDLLETLPQLEAQVDAWFLDGFTPAKNPQMWQPTLYQQMARLSANGASVTTFTSVGEVRRGLIAAGFDMHKVKGYGSKRHMLAGRFLQAPAREWSPPWFSAPIPVKNSERRAVIIGAGLSGCCTAFALARRGWRVTLLDRHPRAAQEASGNPQGILYCKLSPHQTELSRFIQSSFAFGLRQLHQCLPQSEDNWRACGVLQLASNAKEEKRLQTLAAQGYPASFLYGVTADQASKLANMPIEHSGIFFPSAGWVSPPAFCEQLLQHPLISLRGEEEVAELEFQAGQWLVKGADQREICQAPVAIICGAAETMRFAQTQHLPLKAIRGQITHVKATVQSNKLTTVLCADGYISPARSGEHHLGASFRFDRSDTSPSTEENQSNLALLDSLSKAMAVALNREQLDPAQLQGRAALRCTSPDYLPLVGPVVQPQPFAHCYAELGKDASKRPELAAPWYSGLYVNTAHGSRGLISCPLSGELLAAQLNGEPLPLPSDLIRAIHPSRFLLRQLIRGQLRG